MSASPQKKGMLSGDGCLEAVLQRRVGDLAPLGNLMPLVLAVTRAQGTRNRENTGNQHITRRAKGSDQ